MVYSPDEHWNNFSVLRGRRISRKRISPTEFEYLDRSGLRIGTSKLRAKHKMGSVFTAAQDKFQTELRNHRKIGRGAASFDLKKLAKDLEPELLMGSRLHMPELSVGSRIHMRFVGPSDPQPYGTPSQWLLPDGTRLAAFCVGRNKPFQVLLLRSAQDISVAFRFLAPRQQLLRHWYGIRESTNFRHGEAVILQDSFDLSELLPLLVFGFEVLQFINTVPRGG
jgi:hypothetical protein